MTCDDMKLRKITLEARQGTARRLGPMATTPAAASRRIRAGPMAGKLLTPGRKKHLNSARKSSGH